jgi:hypothetical protein
VHAEEDIPARRISAVKKFSQIPEIERQRPFLEYRGDFLRIIIFILGIAYQLYVNNSFIFNDKQDYFVMAQFGTRHAYYSRKLSLPFSE